MRACFFTHAAAQHPEMLAFFLHLNDTVVLRRLFCSLLVCFSAVRLEPCDLLGTVPFGGEESLKKSSGDEHDGNACDAYGSQQ